MDEGDFKAKSPKLPTEILKRVPPAAKEVPVQQRSSSFIGSMRGTMDILGDIVSPLDVHWDVDAE